MNALVLKYKDNGLVRWAVAIILIGAALVLSGLFGPLVGLIAWACALGGASVLVFGKERVMSAMLHSRGAVGRGVGQVIIGILALTALMVALGFTTPASHWKAPLAFYSIESKGPIRDWAAREWLCLWTPVEFIHIGPIQVARCNGGVAYAWGGEWRLWRQSGTTADEAEPSDG